MIKIKICCISSVEEARMAVKAGADVLGLVSKMPSGPGVISDELIAEIQREVGDHVKTFLLTSAMTATDIIAQHNQMQTSSIQIVDYIDLDELKELRLALPRVELVQVVHVENKESINIALQRENLVDAILLDSGKPNADYKTLGGTGEKHNWNWSKEIVDRCSKPVFLAGGLKASNVREAIELVKPYGLDLCSGVRSQDRLDVEKLEAFFEAVRAVDA